MTVPRFMSVILGFVAASFCMPASGVSTDFLTLAERGRPARYEIVLPTSPSLSQVMAAEELQIHIEKMTGVAQMPRSL